MFGLCRRLKTVREAQLNKLEFIEGCLTSVYPAVCNRLNYLFFVPATLLTCSLEWWSFGSRMDWISLTSRDKVPLSFSVESTPTYLPTACTVSMPLFVPVDELLSSHEKPPIGNKDVVVSVSLAKDSDSDSCPSKTTSNQSSPLILRGKRGSLDEGSLVIVAQSDMNAFPS